MTHICKRCNYNTMYLSNYKKHLSTKKHIYTEDLPINECNTLSDPSPTPDPNIFICKYCDQEFAFKQSMYRHIKYSCTKNNDEDLKELVRLLNVQRSEFQEQLQSQSKQIDKLMGKLEINGSFNTTNIQNNIQLLAYKDTDITHLTEHDYSQCIKKVNYCVMKLIEKIHFNPNKPENMNIYISNMKDKYIMVYDGINWNLANRREEIDKLYDEKEMILEEWLEENKDADIKDKFVKYLNNKETDECINRIKDEIKLMMYNKKQLIEN